MSTMRRMHRVALIHPHRGPVTPELWSGTPFGLIEGFRGLGIDVTEIAYDLPRPVTATIHAAASLSARGAASAEHSPIKMVAREAVMRRSLRRDRSLDAIVAVGTDEYRLDRIRPARTLVATYDDATLQTMWAHPDSDMREAGFSEKAVARWIDVQRRSSRAADVSCVSTSWAAESFVRDYSIAPNRVEVVGMGHRPRTGVGRTGRRGSSPVFLFVGIDWKRKNGGAVLEAFSRLRAGHPDAVLHLVGRHDFVEMPGVIDHGLLPRSDVEAQRALDGLYADATAFVLPSLFDPSPIAYLEAASAGLPVIATNQGGASELLRDGAIVVDPQDVGAVTAAMLRLTDAAEAAERGARAQLAAGEATWAHVTARILDALERRAAVAAPDSVREVGGGAR